MILDRREMLIGCTCEETGPKFCPTHSQWVNHNPDTDFSMGEQPQEYVVGFLFSQDHEQVFLIEKQKPEWQRGRLNGIGGKIELGELAIAAMRREFIEEAGLDITSWRLFCKINFKDARVYFFETTHSGGWMPKAMTKEALFVADVARINSLPIIPNLSWLIPMALENSNGYLTTAIATTTK